MAAYYNEIDKNAAAWLRELMKQGLIAQGDVDDRDIRDIQPNELRGYTQCHFFAGIGVWSYALRSAGWADDRPVWTGSCPCQPFSTAGGRAGTADERHLWPHWHHLISQCRPSVVFGEQVASKDGLGWLDLVHADLEGSGYAVGAADLCAAGVGAPHIRQRLWFVGLADAQHKRQQGSLSGHREELGAHGGRSAGDDAGHSTANIMADAVSPRLQGGKRDGETGTQGRPGGYGSECCSAGGLGNSGRPSPTNGHWRDADWLFCRDGKWRAVEPGTLPLAHGSAARVGRLRGYGNAIVPQVAATFIQSVMDLG